MNIWIYLTFGSHTGLFSTLHYLLHPWSLLLKCHQCSFNYENKQTKMPQQISKMPPGNTAHNDNQLNRIIKIGIELTKVVREVENNVHKLFPYLS